jgi:hypothetical protein
MGWGNSVRGEEKEIMRTPLQFFHFVKKSDGILLKNVRGHIHAPQKYDIMR